MKPKPHDPSRHRPRKTVEKYAAMPTENEEMLLRNRAAEPLCMEAWQREIEADKQRYSHDWHDESRGFFERLRGRV